MPDKSIIYLRTSTKEQNPELQEDDCLQFCKTQGLEVVEVIQEQASAYKLNKVRIQWEYVIEKAKKEKLNIVLWRYDRAFRNREEFYKFMKIMFEVYNIKVYSAKETSIMLMWEMLDKVNVPDPIMQELFRGIMKLLWEFTIRQAGEDAQQESLKKSQRVKLAIRKDETGKTLSYKGKAWGRRNISDKTKQAIIEAYKANKPYSLICSEVFYWDKNNNKKFVSKGLVHKIISEFKEGKLSFYN